MQLKKSLNSHHTKKNPKKQATTNTKPSKKKIKTNREKEYDDKRTERQMIEDGITRFSLVQKTLLGEKNQANTLHQNHPKPFNFWVFIHLIGFYQASLYRQLRKIVSFHTSQNG